MSTMFIKVPSTGAAWDAARDLLRPVVAGLGLDVFPGFVKDEGSSARAGYSVYRLAGWDDLAAENDPANMQDSEKLYYNYVSDLGGVLELNTCGADWSGDVYRISIVPASAFAAVAAAPAAVSDGDGLQGSGVNSAEGSAAAGAIPAGSSDNGAGDPDLVTLLLRRSDVCRVSMALLGVKFDFIEEALPLQVDDPRRGVCIRSARAWDALRQEVRRQLQEYDARRGCSVDPWEVA